MQITLDQTEIEAALRRYVEEQVNIREGNEISIDLKAGRGENGFSATIDIQPAGTKAAAEQATGKNPLGIEKATTRSTKPKGPATTDATDAQGKLDLEGKSDGAQEGTQDAAGGSSAEAASDGAAEATAGDQADATGQEGAPEGSNRPSLFANLGKPKNT